MAVNNVYVGVSNKARKVNRMYVGVAGKARKVRKAFIGVNNIARLIFEDGLVKIPSILSFSLARYRAGATANNNYAVFYGGHDADGSSSTGVVAAEGFNKSLTRSNLHISNETSVNYINTCGYPAITSSGVSYACFIYTTGTYFYKTSFTEAGTRSGGIAKSYNGVQTHVNHLNKGVIGFGGTPARVVTSTGGVASLIKVSFNDYDTTFNSVPYLSATADSSKDLAESKFNILTGCNSRYTLAAGGARMAQNGVIQNLTNTRMLSTNVDAFNASLTRTGCTALSVGKFSNTLGTGIGCGRMCGNSTYAIILGGVSQIKGGSGAASVTRERGVEAYNTSLTKTTLANWAYISDYSAENTGDYCVIMGGTVGVSASGTSTNVVATYDESLTLQSLTENKMSAARSNCISVLFNGYLLVGGGLKNWQNITSYVAPTADQLTSIDVYEI